MRRILAAGLLVALGAAARAQRSSGTIVTSNMNDNTASAVWRRSIWSAERSPRRRKIGTWSDGVGFSPVLFRP